VAPAAAARENAKADSGPAKASGSISAVRSGCAPPFGARTSAASTAVQALRTAIWASLGGASVGAWPSGADGKLSPQVASHTTLAASPITARSAIVHDWFQGFHGAERTVDAMRVGLFAPGSAPDVFTFHAAKELLPASLAERIVRESKLARAPILRQRGHAPGRWRYLLPLMPRWFERLDLAPYDVVISSSHACAVNVRTRPDALHVCYCYTPIRYAWMPELEAGRAAGVRRAGLSAFGRRLRDVDLRASRRPSAYFAISESVRERIASFYGRDAAVVHPPVDVSEFDPGRSTERDGFLWVNRLVSYKHPLEVAEAFRGIPYRLTMVGTGPLERELRRALPDNVELLGWLSRDELVRRFERALGFVHVGEEDFGISMVEALAAGTPVLGVRRGGARDIVRNGVDGLLLDEAAPDAIRAGVDAIAGRDWDRVALSVRAQRFSRDRFVAVMRQELGRLGAN
jgi:glycosyltransferase involved in cell wall biosynthesis